MYECPDISRCWDLLWLAWCGTIQESVNPFHGPWEIAETRCLYMKIVDCAMLRADEELLHDSSKIPVLAG